MTARRRAANSWDCQEMVKHQQQDASRHNSHLLGNFFGTCSKWLKSWRRASPPPCPRATEQLGEQQRARLFKLGMRSTPWAPLGQRWSVAARLSRCRVTASCRGWERGEPAGWSRAGLTGGGWPRSAGGCSTLGWRCHGVGQAHRL